MARKVDLPVKKIQTFLDAAVPWLKKCSDYKNGLELRLLATGANQIHVSVGGTSYYVEAVINHPGVSNLADPIYLDLEYLTKFKFQDETMQITIPEGTEKEGRIQFRGPNVSFKIPRRTGERWTQHQQELVELLDIPGFAITASFLSANYKRLMLPNSFGDGVPRAFQVEVTNDPNKVVIYSNDEFGAFCHTFPADSIFPVNKGQNVKVLYEFLLPFKALDKAEEIDLLEFRQDGNQIYGSVEFGESFFERFVWVQPIHTKPIQNVPQVLKENRKGVETSIELNTKEFVQNIDRVTSFYDEANYRENPVAFALVGQQYSLSTTLTNSDMMVEGAAISAVPRPVRARFQAGCLKDYLSCLKTDERSNLELLRSSAVFYQQADAAQLVYWMPIQER